MNKVLSLTVEFTRQSKLKNKRRYRYPIAHNHHDYHQKKKKIIIDF